MAFVEINWNPPLRDLRVFSGLLIAFSGFIAWKFDSSIGQGIAAVAAVVGLVGLIAPQAARPVYVGWMVAVSPIAFVFYVVVLPLAILMRLKHRDALRLKVDRSVSTYWLPRETQRDPRRYFRQY